MLFELQERWLHDKQPHSQSSLAIPDVTSPVKLVEKLAPALGSKPPPLTRIWPWYEAVFQKFKSLQECKPEYLTVSKAVVRIMRHFFSEQENALEETVEACVISLRDLDLHERVFVLTFFFH